jgi:predicted PurR-regulated permease PerM
MNWITEHVTLPYILTLIAGMILGLGLGYLVDYVRAKRGKPVTRQSAVNTVAALVIVLAMVWIMVSTQQARNCAITLNVAVGQEQIIAKIERDAFAKAITASQGVPPAIAALPQNDPARRAYFDPITAEYLDSMGKAAQMRENNHGKQEAAARACGQR